MNAFALILLSWPIYLAVNGRLTTYVALAKPGQKVEAKETEGDSSESSSVVQDVIAGLNMGSK